MLLGPVRSFSRFRFLISSILDPFRFNFGILGRIQYCVFLWDRDCSSSSATRKFSPSPSYLRSGELVLPCDTKNRSSHTQIVHIDILRAQMYLKSAIWVQGPNGPTGPKGPAQWAHWARAQTFFQTFFLKSNGKFPGNFWFGGGWIWKSKVWRARILCSGHLTLHPMGNSKGISRLISEKKKSEKKFRNAGS